MLYRFKLSKISDVHSNCLNAEDLAGVLLSHGMDGAEILNEETLECYAPSPDVMQSIILDGWHVTSIEEIENTNWVQQCEQVFDSVQAGLLSVQPIASAAFISSESTKNQIFLIPGLGFGTGHHATTKTALELFQHPAVTAKAPKTGLDVGTGSGILAIGIAKLHDTDTTAFDTDPDAVENAKENVAINRLSDKVHLAVGTIKQYSNSYDIVIANIYAEVLIELKNDLYERVNRSGTLVMSGIMNIKRNLICEHFHEPFWKMIDERIVDGWVSILLEKQR